MTSHKHSIHQRNVENIPLAAEQVFAEKGFAGTFLGDIAEAVQLPRSNVHYYSSRARAAIKANQP